MSCDRHDELVWPSNIRLRCGCRVTVESTAESSIQTSDLIDNQKDTKV